MQSVLKHCPADTGAIMVNGTFYTVNQNCELYSEIVGEKLDLSWILCGQKILDICLTFEKSI
jgi:hypothetical protein